MNIDQRKWSTIRGGVGRAIRTLCASSREVPETSTKDMEKGLPHDDVETWAEPFEQEHKSWIHLGTWTKKL